jgi:hypothetical protein
MHGLIQHLDCLDELARDARRRPPPVDRASTLVAVVGMGLTAVGIAGIYFLEALALERLGLR